MSEIRRKRTLFLGILVALLTAGHATEQLTAQAPVAALTGPAVLDDWGNRFTSLGASVPENPLRTQVRTHHRADGDVRRRQRRPPRTLSPLRVDACLRPEAHHRKPRRSGRPTSSP